MAAIDSVYMSMVIAVMAVFVLATALSVFFLLLLMHFISIIISIIIAYITTNIVVEIDRLQLLRSPVPWYRLPAAQHGQGC